MISWNRSTRAAFIAALFFSASMCGWAQAQQKYAVDSVIGGRPSIKSSKQVKIETYTDIIEKAYNLSLQKERIQAILILVNSIKKETKKSPRAFKELTKALDQVSNAFYSDKTQQLYELGISIRISDPSLANQKIAEALKLEPDNLAAQLAQLRIQIMLGDCGAALSSARKIKETNPYTEEIDLVISQAAVCVGQFDAYQQAKAVVDEKHSALLRHWNAVEMEYLFRKGQFEKGIELCQSLEKLEPQFPESFYWQWKMELELKTQPETAAAKYLNLCKALSARAFRDYLAEPLLCRRTTEVESFLKKNNNPNL